MRKDARCSQGDRGRVRSTLDWWHCGQFRSRPIRSTPRHYNSVSSSDAPVTFELYRALRASQAEHQLADGASVPSTRPCTLPSDLPSFQTSVTRTDSCTPLIAGSSEL